MLGLKLNHVSKRGPMCHWVTSESTRRVLYCHPTITNALGELWIIYTLVGILLSIIKFIQYVFPKSSPYPISREPHHNLALQPISDKIHHWPRLGTNFTNSSSFVIQNRWKCVIRFRPFHWYKFCTNCRVIRKICSDSCFRNWQRAKWNVLGLVISLEYH